MFVQIGAGGIFDSMLLWLYRSEYFIFLNTEVVVAHETGGWPLVLCWSNITVRKVGVAVSVDIATIWDEKISSRSEYWTTLRMMRHCEQFLREGFKKQSLKLIKFFIGDLSPPIKPFYVTIFFKKNIVLSKFMHS